MNPPYTFLFDPKNHHTEMWFFECLYGTTILPDPAGIASESRKTAEITRSSSTGPSLAMGESAS
jgi:hypothetical protein